MTTVKGFETSKNRSEQRNMQYLLYKDFAIKANALKTGLKKAVRKTILPCETKRHFEKSFSFLLLESLIARN